MTQPPEQRPNTAEINLLIDRICRHIESSSKTESQLLSKLLRFLVHFHDSDHASNLSGPAIVDKFYVSIGRDEPKVQAASRNRKRRDPRAVDSGAEQDASTRNRRLVSALRRAVMAYYGQLYCDDQDEQIVMRIPLGNRYKPEFRYKHIPSRDLPPPQDFEYIGTNNAALERVIEMIPSATMIEDTTVRWYPGSLQYQTEKMRRFGEALKANRSLVFRCLMGPLVDEVYAREVTSAFKERPDQLEMFRLRHTAPLMNFLIIYGPSVASKDIPMAVFFGYGRNRPDKALDDTAVFMTTHPRLMSEFRKLFNVFRDITFSLHIPSSNPELMTSQIHRLKCDVLATFTRFPVLDIVAKLALLRKGARIQVCMTAWPDLSADVEDPLRKALRKGATLDVTFWEHSSDFLRLRSMMIKGREGYVERELEQSLETMRTLSYEFKEQVRLGSTKLPLGSVTIIWIDDVIYFSSYWLGMDAARGPHFVVPAESDTGKKLQDQYRRMSAFDA